ncbi:MAG TPA: chemotaxis protein CheB [Vicinamibacterales bacterium]|nr:chemotaxis protein CheB [Vicinamibacterales bacterium]
MASHDVIVIGASAGGVEAISALVSGLPRDLRAAVLVVLHVSSGRSLLPEILTRAGRLPASHPADEEPIQYGRVYVAPPDRHMVVERGRVRIVQTPLENGVRPAVDPLFRSAAREYGARVIGVILTGALDDGTAGLAAVKQAGGVTIVQDPAEALSPSMPSSAMSVVRVDHVLPIIEIPPLLVALSREPARPRHRLTPISSAALDPLEPDLQAPSIPREEQDRPGRLAVYSCPACHGTLWEVEEGGLLRFRCRVGHVYSAESMLAAQSDEVDRALWTALRSLDERVALTKRMAERASANDHEFVARAFAHRSESAARDAALLRDIITARTAPPAPEEAADGPGDPVSDETLAAPASVDGRDAG